MRLTGLLTLFLLTGYGCAVEKAADIAAERGMRVQRVAGDGFSHFVALRDAARAGRRLHVYIEGDGIPWIGRHPALDPTPADPLALRLAGLDPNAVAYVGRPCYFGYNDSDARCHPRYWTSHRYGPAVVRSMAAVIDGLAAGYVDVVLIGYSGGGSLAALLETELDDVAAVVTVAANLDVDAWTARHGYDPLLPSGNPAARTRRNDIPHVQLVGGRDAIVPVGTSSGYAEHQPGVIRIEYSDFGHVCCWEREWREILERVALELRKFYAGVAASDTGAKR